MKFLVLKSLNFKFMTIVNALSIYMHVVIFYAMYRFVNIDYKASLYAYKSVAILNSVLFIICLL